jgi:RND family efflux transporter MFP subunit
MRILLVVGIPILAIIAVFGMVSMKPEPPKKERVDLDPVVEVLRLETMTANFEVLSQGTVRPKTETILSAEVSGTITEISPKFVAGGVFQRNEVLLRIDPTNYLVELKQAEALVKQRQIEFDGATKLRAQGYRAEAELASAAAALATSEANLVRAKRNLERTYIRLPYEGIVRAKETDLGQFVNPGTRLGVVFATNFAEVRLPLTDADLAFVEMPDAAAITASGGADGPTVTLSATQKSKRVEWPATIVRTEGVVDESSRVTYAVARVSDPYRLHTDGNALPMGTFVAAVIQGATAEGIMRVPRGVVRGADELLFVDENNTIRIRTVKIVRSDADYVYVSDGAVPGERVVLTALQTPVNGMAVRIAGETAAAEPAALVTPEAEEQS